MKIKKTLMGLLFLSLVAIGSQSCQKTEEDDDNQPPVQPADITETAFGLNLKLVKVNGGTFQMGSDEYDNEQPVHSVTLSTFYIGKFEVTQAQWRAVMGTSPSYFAGCDNCPVEQVLWDDVLVFFQKLNQASGRNYTLPTEAQWEYAAGGGATARTKWAGTDSESSLGSYAWYDGNSTHPVGTKSPNGLGLYDMGGNVWERCSDWYGSYTSGSQSNPVGPSTGSRRVRRGGGWSSNSTHCRVAFRTDAPATRYLGFRVVLVP